MRLIVHGNRRRIFVSVAALPKICDQQLKLYMLQLLFSPEKKHCKPQSQALELLLITSKLSPVFSKLNYSLSLTELYPWKQPSPVCGRNTHSSAVQYPSWEKHVVGDSFLVSKCCCLFCGALSWLKLPPNTDAEACKTFLH